MLIDFREEGGKGEKETSIGCLPYAPWPKIEPTIFWCTRWFSYQLSHPPCQGEKQIILNVIYW